MTLGDLIPHLAGLLTVVANAIVCGAAIECYRHRARRSVLLIAVSAGLGALLSVVTWVAETPARGFWQLMELAFAADLVLWTVGICLLFRELSKAELPDN